MSHIFWPRLAVGGGETCSGGVDQKIGQTCLNCHTSTWTVSSLYVDSYEASDDSK
jgi:hypothetical protein